MKGRYAAKRTRYNSLDKQPARGAEFADSPLLDRAHESTRERISEGPPAIAEPSQVTKTCARCGRRGMRGFTKLGAQDFCASTAACTKRAR